MEITTHGAACHLAECPIRREPVIAVQAKVIRGTYTAAKEVAERPVGGESQGRFFPRYPSPSPSLSVKAPPSAF
jgi:hypothetical protein